MTPRILNAFRMALTLTALMLAMLPAFASANRDPLASVVDLSSPQIEIVPPGLFNRDQTTAIDGVVNEARQFGVPLAVRIISSPTSLDVLPESSVIDGASPAGQQLVQRMAEEWLANEPIETSPGAGDGMLLLVIIPEDDHTRTLASFATGPNALPLNGLTQASLDRALNEVMYPLFARNTIATGIHSGIAMLSYDNLFAVPAPRELTHQQEYLHRLTNVGLTTLTLLSVLSLGGLVFWLPRRDKTSLIADREIHSPFVAGALARGRVDTSVSTGALIHLLHIGAIQSIRGRSGEMILSVEHVARVADPFAHHVLQLLAAEADSDLHVQGAAVRRIQDVLTPARIRLRDNLAANQLFNRDALIETMWVILACGGVAAIALLSLMPSIIGLSRGGIAGIAIASIAIALTLYWVSRRSWTTHAGKTALANWQSGSLSPGDQPIYEAIVNQEALLSTPGGPGRSEATNLVRNLRGLGAG